MEGCNKLSPPATGWTNCRHRRRALLWSKICSQKICRQCYTSWSRHDLNPAKPIWRFAGALRDWNRTCVASSGSATNLNVSSRRSKLTIRSNVVRGVPSFAHRQYRTPLRGTGYCSTETACGTSSTTLHESSTPTVRTRHPNVLSLSTKEIDCLVLVAHGIMAEPVAVPAVIASSILLRQGDEFPGARIADVNVPRWIFCMV